MNIVQAEFGSHLGAGINFFFSTTRRSLPPEKSRSPRLDREVRAAASNDGIQLLGV
jgi:hypothetical protein